MNNTLKVVGSFGILLLSGLGCKLNNRPSEKEFIEASRVAKMVVSTNSDPACVVWRGFTNKWPASKIGMGFHYDPGDELYKGIITASAIIEQRYVFETALRFELSRDLSKLEYENPKYYFHEVESVTAVPGGGWTGKSGQLQGEFKMQDWIKFTNANYDFHSLGLDLRSNAPVKNIAAPGMKWSTVPGTSSIQSNK